MKKASSDLLLLDVNVLLAIAWPNHQFHAAAIAALSSQNRWATCALTQLGFIRLSSNPAAIPTAKTPQEATGLLARLVADSLHTYLDSLPAPVSEDCRDAFRNRPGSSASDGRVPPEAGGCQWRRGCHSRPQIGERGGRQAEG
jgi:predicted nucleic acid-binding protein